MSRPVVDCLEGPGADLYCEVRGSGPALLMIPGGNGDAGPYAAVAEALAARYTVITYDRRGFSRSPLRGPPRDEKGLEIDSDDARRLIDRLADGSAHVFGSSSGAIVGLDLLARYPAKVHLLVAHEPPLVTLLADATAQLAFADEVYDTYRRSGVAEAMRMFFAGVGAKGLAGADRLGTLVTQLARFTPLRRLAVAAGAPIHRIDMLARIQANQPFWLEHELREYIRYAPDFGALQAASDQLILAGGRDSRAYFPYRPNVVLAERLGLAVVDFPDGHVGYATNPRGFAARLHDVLASKERSQLRVHNAGSRCPLSRVR
jgi:pimeloyl-ACP methyl ester carboxylesterase